MSDFKRPHSQSRIEDLIEKGMIDAFGCEGDDRLSMLLRSSWEDIKAKYPEISVPPAAERLENGASGELEFLHAIFECVVQNGDVQLYDVYGAFQESIEQRVNSKLKPKRRKRALILLKPHAQKPSMHFLIKVVLRGLEELNFEDTNEYIWKLCPEKLLSNIIQSGGRNALKIIVSEIQILLSHQSVDLPTRLQQLERRSRIKSIIGSSPNAYAVFAHACCEQSLLKTAADEFCLVSKGYDKNFLMGQFPAFAKVFGCIMESKEWSNSLAKKLHRYLVALLKEEEELHTTAYNDLNEKFEDENKAFLTQNLSDLLEKFVSLCSVEDVDLMNHDGNDIVYISHACKSGKYDSIAEMVAEIDELLSTLKDEHNSYRLNRVLLKWSMWKKEALEDFHSVQYSELVDAWFNLSALDSARYFLMPISDTMAPGYTQVVADPISLETIRRNIMEGICTDILTFTKDVHTMIANCLHYYEMRSRHGQYALAVLEGYEHFLSRTHPSLTFPAFSDALSRSAEKLVVDQSTQTVDLQDTLAPIVVEVSESVDAATMPFLTTTTNPSYSAMPNINGSLQSLSSDSSPHATTTTPQSVAPVPKPVAPHEKPINLVLLWCKLVDLDRNHYFLPNNLPDNIPPELKNLSKLLEEIFLNRYLTVGQFDAAVEAMINEGIAWHAKQSHAGQAAKEMEQYKMAYSTWRSRKYPVVKGPTLEQRSNSLRKRLLQMWLEVVEADSQRRLYASIRPNGSEPNCRYLVDLRGTILDNRYTQISEFCDEVRNTIAQKLKQVCHDSSSSTYFSALERRVLSRWATADKSPDEVSITKVPSAPLVPAPLPASLPPSLRSPPPKTLPVPVAKSVVLVASSSTQGRRPSGGRGILDNRVTEVMAEVDTRPLNTNLSQLTWDTNLESEPVLSSAQNIVHRFVHTDQNCSQDIPKLRYIARALFEEILPPIFVPSYTSLSHSIQMQSARLPSEQLRKQLDDACSFLADVDKRMNRICRVICGSESRDVFSTSEATVLDWLRNRVSDNRYQHIYAFHKDILFYCCQYVVHYRFGSDFVAAALCIAVHWMDYLRRAPVNATSPTSDIEDLAVVLPESIVASSTSATIQKNVRFGDSFSVEFDPAMASSDFVRGPNSESSNFSTNCGSSSFASISSIRLNNAINDGEFRSSVTERNNNESLSCNVNGTHVVTSAASPLGKRKLIQGAITAATVGGDSSVALTHQKLDSPPSKRPKIPILSPAVQHLAVDGQTNCSPGVVHATNSYDSDVNETDVQMILSNTNARENVMNLMMDADDDDDTRLYNAVQLHEHRYLHQDPLGNCESTQCNSEHEVAPPPAVSSKAHPKTESPCRPRRPLPHASLLALRKCLEEVHLQSQRAASEDGCSSSSFKGPLPGLNPITLSPEAMDGEGNDRDEVRRHTLCWALLLLKSDQFQSTVLTPYLVTTLARVIRSTFEPGSTGDNDTATSLCTDDSFFFCLQLWLMALSPVFVIVDVSNRDVFLTPLLQQLSNYCRPYDTSRRQLSSDIAVCRDDQPNQYAKHLQQAILFRQSTSSSNGTRQGNDHGDSSNHGASDILHKEVTRLFEQVRKCYESHP